MTTPAQFAARIALCWSEHSASCFRADNPALGQCSVTALVVQDIWGGRIAKTDVAGAWHCYNIVCGVRHDFSSAQFDAVPAYRDLMTTREDALSDTSEEQYAALRDAYAMLV